MNYLKFFSMFQEQIKISITFKKVYRQLLLKSRYVNLPKVPANFCFILVAWVCIALM